MEKENAIKQTREPLHERRKQVVRLYKEGTKIMQTAVMKGASYPAVISAADLFEAGGWGVIYGAGQLIEQKSGIQLQVRNIGKYFTRRGFTPKQSIKHTYEQNPVSAQAWLQGKCHTIEQCIKAEIFEFLHDILCIMRLAHLFCKVRFATTEHTCHLFQMR